MPPVVSSNSAAAAASAAAQPAPKKRTRDEPPEGPAQGSNRKKARVPQTLEQAVCTAPLEDVPLILGPRLATEMAAITALYDNCVDLEDRHLEPYTRDGLWEVQFGAPYDETDNIPAMIGIIKQYGCLPSDITPERQAFINDGFIDAMGEIDDVGDGALSELMLSDMGLILLPPRLWECESLEELELNDNALTVLPDGINALSNLIDLSVKGNQLRTLPALPNLTDLGLDGNLLVHLPESIKNCNALKILELDGVGLAELPGWIGELSQLEELYLDGNALTDLPAELASLKALTLLYIQGNEFMSRPAVLAQLPAECSIEGQEDLPDDSGAAAAAAE